MLDDETIVDFNERLHDIANYSSALCEKMSEVKLVRKIMISLRKSFYMNATSIEEEPYVSIMKIDELFGFFLTFEMTIDGKPEKKSKGMAFKSIMVYHGDKIYNVTNENIVEFIIILANNFRNVIRRLGITPRNNVSPNVKHKKQQTPTTGNFQL